MIIYKITNKINGKVYIGQTKYSAKKRWECHKKNSYCSALHRAIKKYGEENFTIEEIDGANSQSELNYLEQHYIHIYNSMAPNGYNLMTGGNSNSRVSDETRQKIRMSRLGKPSPKKGIKSNKPAWNKGLKLTKEQRKNLGRKKGCSVWSKGVPMKEETKRKLSEAKKGRPGTWLGRKHSEESKQKMSETKRLKRLLRNA